jgi:uncharacterized protein (TIRG00374 family)
MKGILRKRALWVAAAILMAALLYWGRHDLGKIATLSPLPLVLCFVSTAGIAISSALKWKVAIGSMGDSRATHLGSLIHYFMIGRVLGLVVPMDLGDFAARTASLKMDHSMPIGRASYSVYLDRAFDVVVAGILLVPSILFIVGAVGAGAGIAIYCLAFLAGLLCFVFLGKRTTDSLYVLFHLLFKVVCKIPGLRNRVDSQAERDLLTAPDSKSVARTLYLLSGLKFLFTATRFASIALAMRLAVGAVDMLLFAPGAQFAAVFSFTPGGMGIVDWSWSGLLYKIGVDRHDIVPYLVSLRLATWISVLILAGLSRLLYRKPFRERMRAGSEDD